MKKIFFIVAVFCLCSVSFAQSNITLELKDAPVRTTVEMIFKQAGIKNYVIDNSVAGFVTMKLEDQPFENSLKLVMRANTIPLTYLKENDVWIVKSRRIKIEANPDPNFDSDPLPVKSNSFQVIRLNHIDPFDLMSVFGNILFVNQFQRFQGGMNNNNGGFGGGRNF
jgi:type II secretory pathway component GspD/PulD (secretin)